MSNENGKKPSVKATVKSKEIITNMLGGKVLKTVGLNDIEISEEYVKALEPFTSNKEHMSNLLEYAFDSIGLVSFSKEFKKELDKKKEEPLTNNA